MTAEEIKISLFLSLISSLIYCIIGWATHPVLLEIGHPFESVRVEFDVSLPVGHLYLTDMVHGTKS